MSSPNNRRDPVEWHEVAVFPILERLPSKPEPAVRVTMSCTGPLLFSYEVGQLGPAGFQGRRFMRHKFMRRYLELQAVALALVELSMERADAKLAELRVTRDRAEFHGKLRVSLGELAKVSPEELKKLTEGG